MKTLSYRDSSYSEVTLSQNLADKIKNSLITKYKTPLLTFLGKKVGVYPETLARLFNGKQIKVHTLERIRKSISIDSKEIEKEIIWIDSIDEPKLPINFDCIDGVRIDAGIFNEGRIRKRGVEYVNKDRELIHLVRRCAKNLIGEKFEPTTWIDKRQQVLVLYFPTFFAKHYTQLGFTEGINKECIPNYVKKGPEEYWKTWLQAAISEDGCIYPFANYHKGCRKFYLYPRLQINRTVRIKVDLKAEKRTNIYRSKLPMNLTTKLEKKSHQLLLDEASLFSSFGIHTKVRFSRLHFSDCYNTTAAYSLTVCKEKDFIKILDQIEFELKRHETQAKLLLENRGALNKDRLNDTVYKFYKLTPAYLREKKKIGENKWLEKEQKIELIGEKND